MKRVFRNNKIFLVPYILILLAIFPFFLLYSKTEIHLWINSHNSPFADGFFSVITWLGDGFVVFFAGVAVLLFSFRKGLLVLSSYLLSGLLVQVLKRFIFTDSLRPYSFFDGKAELHLIKGVEMLGSRSFPSGHSASAFAFFLSLAMMTSRNTIKIICLVSATAVAYSRVYLSQHFLSDIYLGSVIGVASALAVYWFLSIKDRSWYELSVISLFKSRSSSLKNNHAGHQGNYK